MIKYFRSSELNFLFDNTNGFTATWGRTRKEDALFSPYGPMIIDCEISTICHGVGNTGNGCIWCYKSNTEIGKNMSYETFVKLFSKLPKNVLTQVAFGIGSIDSNEHLWNIMQHCRENNIIPNITINGSRMTPKYYDKLASLCGAIAVSRYDKDTCYNAVYELTSRGMGQCNIHVLAAHENYNTCIQVIQDMKQDKRLERMNAVVYLALKPRGERNTYTKLSKQEFQNIVDTAIAQKINFGFDSCSSHNFLEAAKDKDNIEQLKMMVEPCEGTCFSYYVSVEGIGYPCSFCEGRPNYKGIDILTCNDFINDVWLHPETIAFRNRNIKSTGHCVEYDLKLT